MNAFVSPADLRRRLRRAGVSLELIEAAWPQWWSDDAIGSPSAGAELRFTLARRLGLSPSALLREEPVFVFRNAAKYKSLSQEVGEDEAALTSFGLSVARLITAATVPGETPVGISASEIRGSVLRSWAFVTLESLITLCWALGIPVVYLRVFPLEAKRMHAMSVRVGERYAVLLGRDTTYPAALAFTLAHEIGHIALGHFDDHSAVVDFGDPATDGVGDDEESQATNFALELLTGNSTFSVEADRESFNSAQLVDSAVRASQSIRVEPAMLALALGHSTGRWTQALAAMKSMGAVNEDLVQWVNDIARSQLALELIGEDEGDYIDHLLTDRHA